MMLLAGGHAATGVLQASCASSALPTDARACAQILVGMGTHVGQGTTWDVAVCVPLLLCPTCKDRGSGCLCWAWPSQ